MTNSAKLQDRVNTQKLVVFLCTNNEHPEKELKKMISFTIVPKGKKYLKINLSKEVKDLYTDIHDRN